MKITYDPKAIAIVGVWSAYVILLYLYFDKMVQMIATSSTIVGIILFILANPIYLMFGYSVWEYGKKRGTAYWKRVVASVLIIVAGDFVSLPRVTISTPLTGNAEVITNFEVMVMKFLEGFIPHGLSFVVVYIIIPIVCVAVSLELLGVTDWWRTVKK